jgi:hypothetical protein
MSKSLRRLEFVSEEAQNFTTCKECGGTLKLKTSDRFYGSPIVGRKLLASTAQIPSLRADWTDDAHRH